MNTKRFKIAGLIALSLVLMVTIAACDTADDPVDEEVTAEFDVSVVVVDEDAEGLEDADVELGDLEGTTDEDGAYTFDDVEEGDYELSVTLEDYTADSDDVGTVTVDEDSTSFSVTMIADEEDDPVDDDPVDEPVENTMFLNMGNWWDVDVDDVDYTTDDDIYFLAEEQEDRSFDLIFENKTDETVTYDFRYRLVDEDGFVVEDRTDDEWKDVILDNNTRNRIASGITLDLDDLEQAGMHELRLYYKESNEENASWNKFDTFENIMIGAVGVENFVDEDADGEYGDYDELFETFATLSDAIAAAEVVTDTSGTTDANMAPKIDVVFDLEESADVVLDADTFDKEVAATAAGTIQADANINLGGHEIDLNNNALVIEIPVEVKGSGYELLGDLTVEAAGASVTDFAEIDGDVDLSEGTDDNPVVLTGNSEVTGDLDIDNYADITDVTLTDGDINLKEDANVTFSNVTVAEGDFNAVEGARFRGITADDVTEGDFNAPEDTSLVDSSQTLLDAFGERIELITFEEGITLDDAVTVRYPVTLDLNTFTFTVDGATLTFNYDATIENGELDAEGNIEGADGINLTFEDIDFADGIELGKGEGHRITFAGDIEFLDDATLTGSSVRYTGGVNLESDTPVTVGGVTLFDNLTFEQGVSVDGDEVEFRDVTLLEKLATNGDEINVVKNSHLTFDRTQFIDSPVTISGITTGLSSLNYSDTDFGNVNGRVVAQNNITVSAINFANLEVDDSTVVNVENSASGSFENYGNDDGELQVNGDATLYNADVNVTTVSALTESALESVDFGTDVVTVSATSMDTITMEDVSFASEETTVDVTGTSIKLEGSLSGTTVVDEATTIDFGSSTTDSIVLQDDTTISDINFKNVTPGSIDLNSNELTLKDVRVDGELVSDATDDLTTTSTGVTIE